MLAESKPFGRFADAEVFVSDAFGRLALMPWQSKLDSEIQIKAYGDACLEAAGHSPVEGWASYAGFRHHAANGLAAALPLSVIETLRDLLARRGVRLRSVMPISAGAYWHHKADCKASTSLLWLEEVGRLTALVYRRGKLAAIDVEPQLQRDGADLRLLNRVQLSFGSIARIDCWRSTENGFDTGKMGSRLEGATVSVIENSRWSIK